MERRSAKDRGYRRLSVTFNFFRTDAEPIGDSFQRLRVRLPYLVALDAGDLLRGNRREIASLQPPLLPQPHQRGPERPLTLPALLLEPAPVVGVNLIKDRVRRRFVIAEGDCPGMEKGTLLISIV